MKSNNFAKRYRDGMAVHSFGYALFDPPKFSDFHPGKVGYIDTTGHWWPIVDLADKKALKDGGYTKFRLPVGKEPDPQAWGPHKTENVTDFNINLEGGVNAASMGFPVDIGGVLEYVSQEDFGAVLMCDDKVVVEGFDVRGIFMDWLEENARVIKKNCKDAYKHGVVYAIIQTYSSNKIFIQSFGGQGQKVHVGFKVGAPGVGHAKPEMSWYRSSFSSGWRFVNDGDANDKKVISFLSVTLTFGPMGFLNQVRGGGDQRRLKLDEPEDGEPCEVLIE